MQTTATTENAALTLMHDQLHTALTSRRRPSTSDDYARVLLTEASQHITAGRYNLAAHQLVQAAELIG